MPIYEFTCGDHRFEAFRSVADRDRAASCPVCGGLGERVFDPASVRLQVPGNWRQWDRFDRTAFKAEVGSGEWETLSRPKWNRAVGPRREKSEHYPARPVYSVPK